jgi:hypothetical protein
MPLLHNGLLQSMQGCCKISNPAAPVADFAAPEKIIFLSD